MSALPRLGGRRAPSPRLVRAELLRRAALLAATRTPGAGDLAVPADDLSRALTELLDTRDAMTRTLLDSSAGSPGGYA